MDTDSFVLSYTEGKVSDQHMDLSNLDCPFKTNNKVPVSKVIEEFIALSPKTNSMVIHGRSPFKYYPKRKE